MMSARQIYLGSRRGPALPYDAEVEYLESTGTQYIDTGVIAADNVGVQMDVVGGNTPSGPNFPTTMLFGVFGSDNRYGLGYNSRFFAWWNTASPGESFSGAYSGTFSLNYNNSRTFACGTYYSGSLSGTYNASNTQIRLLNALRMDTGQNAFADCASCRFGAIRITQGMTLVRDLIPVRKGDAGYLYDRITGQLLGNAGTGAFSFGTDIAGGGYKCLGYSPLRFSRFSRLWKEAA